MKFCKSVNVSSAKSWLTPEFRLPNVAAAALVASSALLMCDLHTANAQDTGEYKIGSLSDLSGPIAQISRPATAGLRAFIAATNAKGGVNGHKIALEVRDTKSDAQSARTQFSALVSSGVSAVVGPDLSTAYTAVAPLALTAKVPMLSEGTPNDLVATPGQPYYSTTFPLVYCAKIEVDNIKSQWKGGAAPRIAALHSNSALTITWRDALIQDVKKVFGNELVAAEQLDASAINVGPSVSKIMEGKPDFVLLRILGTQVPLAIRALREKGFTGPILTDYNGADSAVLKSVDDPNYLAIRAFADPTDVADPAVQKMLADAKAAGVEGEATSAFFTYGYVNGLLVVQALKSCGTPCNGEAFNKAMSTLKPEAISGLSGPLGYQDETRKLVNFGRFYKWDSAKGAAAPVSDWINGAK